MTIKPYDSLNGLTMRRATASHTDPACPRRNLCNGGSLYSLLLTWLPSPLIVLIAGQLVLSLQGQLVRGETIFFTNCDEMIDSKLQEHYTNAFQVTFSTNKMVMLPRSFLLDLVKEVQSDAFKQLVTERTIKSNKV